MSAEHLAAMEALASGMVAGEWAAATDGHRLILYRGLTVPTLKWELGTGPYGLAERLVAEDAGDHGFTLAGVMAWANPPGNPQCPSCRGRKAFKCRTCDGSVVTECQCACGDVHTIACACRGKLIACDEPGCDPPMWRDIRPGLLYGHLFNRDLIADTLRFAPPTLTASVKTANPKRPDEMAAFFYGHGFRAVVMGMSDNGYGDAVGTDERACPAFGAIVSDEVRA